YTDSGPPAGPRRQPRAAGRADAALSRCGAQGETRCRRAAHAGARRKALSHPAREAGGLLGGGSPLPVLTEAQLHVAERRVFLDRDLVFDQHAAAGAAELPELRGRIDEALRIADDRVRFLDRPVISHAVISIVISDGAEGGRAFCAAILAAA